MSALPPLPFPRTYWVIPGQLMAGLFPGAPLQTDARPRMQALFNCGIRHIINLMEEDERNYQGQLFTPYFEDFQAAAAEQGEAVTFARYAIRDGGVPTPALMKAILDDIDRSLAAGKPVYVHCWGGKGRTGTVIGCYLARHGLASGSAILERITALRQAIQPYAESPETDEQRRFVLSWRE